MKKSLTILVILFSFTVVAQPNKDKMDKMKAIKVAYITKELNLSSAEAEKFWPVYNLFDQKQFELRHTKTRAIMRKINEQGFSQMDEKDANAILTQLENIDEELVSLRKKFVADAKPILGAKKVLQLKKVEEEFTRTLLKQFKDKK